MRDDAGLCEHERRHHRLHGSVVEGQLALLLQQLDLRQPHALVEDRAAGGHGPVRRGDRLMRDAREEANMDHPARILIVDDAEDMRELFRFSLELDGHQVTVASNGTEALEELGRSQPDVLVLDLTMPDMDGWD